MDTGVGSHAWFADDDVADRVVVRDPVVAGKPVGLCPEPDFPYQHPEVGGVSIYPITGPLDPVAGHGTFMAGLVHQMCPDAAILAPRVYGGAGVVPESDLLRSLRRLLLWHLLGLAEVPGYAPVDVAVLALGYYHERPDDADFDVPLGAVLTALRRWGVLVVTSSGNDGQVRETYPAAFAPRLNRRTDPPTPLDGVTLREEEPPVIAVGAQNPDETTALFSNDGPWVTCLRPGAALVSTAPTTIDGVVAPSRHMKELFTGKRRSTIDPEGFQGGFAVWSGTSFAAPVLAGELAAALLGAGVPEPRKPAPGGDPHRCRWLWPAVTAATKLTPGG
jgi:subtilisin family serine protease